MRDTTKVVEAHGYKPCFTDQDCGAPRPTPTTKPYHYECDSKSQTLRDQNDLYYKCIKVNTPGKDTCSFDLIGVAGITNKALIDRLMKANGSKTDLSNYSSQCKNLTIPTTSYKCDTSNYQCVVSVFGNYTSLANCQFYCKKSVTPPVTIAPTPVPVPGPGPGATPTITRETTPPVTFNPTGCSVRSFDVDPRTLGLLSISEGRKFAGL